MKVYYKDASNPEYKMNSPLVEPAIYTCVVPILLEFNTPYLVPFVSFHKCNAKQQKQLKIVDNDEEARKNGELYLIFTKMFPTSINLLDLMNSEKYDFTAQTFAEMNFKMHWNLMCFAAIGLRHNDLHFGNSLVTLHNGEKKASYFQFKDVYLKIDDDWDMLTFDWDRSSLSKVIENDDLGGECPKALGCNFSNKGWDTFRYYSMLESEKTTFVGKKPIMDMFKSITAVYSDIFNQHFGDTNIYPSDDHWAYSPPPLDFINKKEKSQNVEKMKKYYNEKELIIDIDPEYVFEQILTKTSIFDSFKIEKNSIPKEATIYTLPTKKTRNVIKHLTKKYFPSVLPK